jgi:hypothetical protein
MMGSFELFMGGGFNINSKLASKQPVMMSIRSFLLPTRNRMCSSRLSFVRWVFTV